MNVWQIVVSAVVSALVTIILGMIIIIFVINNKELVDTEIGIIFNPFFHIR